MPKESGGVGLLGLAVLAYLLAYQVGAALYPVFAELAACLAILTLGFALSAGMPPVDRTTRTALLTVLLLSFFQEGLLWQRGDSHPALSVFLHVAARTGFMSAMMIWTALVSARRGPGQYIYNLTVVGALALLMGQYLANLFGSIPGSISGALPALLQGACTGCGFAYITVRIPAQDRTATA
jgi:hypothetical protein